MGDRQAAVNFYNQAVKSSQDKSDPQYLTHAYQLFGSAVWADPTWSEAWYQVGNNNSDLNLLNAAVADWRRAIEHTTDPKERAKILVNMGWRLHGLGRTHEALAASQEAVVLDPGLAYGWLNLSLIYGLLGDPTTGLAAAETAFRLSPKDVVIEMALAFALLFARRFADGLRYFEARFPYRLKNFTQFPYPKWIGEPDRTVYLVADQGLGDTLSYARFVEQACGRAKFVHAAVQPELMRLFNHAFGHIANLNLLPQPTVFPPADCWTTFVSLPFALGLDDTQIRQARNIAIPHFSMPENWKVPDRKFHIGIAWAGSPLNEIDRHRNVPVTQFLELYRVPGVQLYGLQVGERNKDMYDFGAAALIRDLTPYIRDVVDTTAILRELDLVITIESALGHIAAATDAECWIPYSWQGRDYRLGVDGSDRLWAPRHRVFPQDASLRWEPVFVKIVEALRERFHA